LRERKCEKVAAVELKEKRGCRMDTARLRALREFPHVQLLLRSLLTNQNFVPAGSQYIESAAELTHAQRMSRS
jgi:hypothetical protein